MPVSITTEGLLNALRLNLNEPMALEIGRLRAYAEVLVEKLAPDAPTSVLNQAMVQLVGYLFENPIGLGSMRQSGASETLAPYRGSNVSIPIPSGGLSANAILQLIAAHAAISAVHHVPGDAGVPGNIDDAAVQNL